MSTPQPLGLGDRNFAPSGLDRPQTAPAVLYGYQVTVTPKWSANAVPVSTYVYPYTKYMIVRLSVNGNHP